MQSWTGWGALILGIALLASGSAARVRAGQRPRQGFRTWPLWAKIAFFLGMFVSAFGSARLRNESLGWWSFLIWMVLVAAATYLPLVLLRKKVDR